MTTESPKQSKKKPPSPIKLNSLLSGEDAEWVEIDEVPGAKLHVRPIDYPPYTKARQVLIQRWVRAYKKEPIPEKVQVPALGALYAEHLLLGWEGFDVPYSPEAAESRLSDWAWRKFVRIVEAAAASLTVVNAETVEDAGKNSGQPSATT